MDDQGQVPDSRVEPGENARPSGIERRPRSDAVRLALVSLALSLSAFILALIAVVPVRIYFQPRGNVEWLYLFLGFSGLVATSGIVVGNIALAKIRRTPMKKPPITLARVGLIFGYGWWALVSCVAIPVVAVFIEVPRVVLLQEGKQPWSTLVGAMLLFVVSQFCLLLESRGMPYRYPVVGSVGTLELGFLATWSLFADRTVLSDSRRMLYAVVFYSLGLASVVVGWFLWNVP